MVTQKSLQEIQIMRDAGRIVGQTLQYLGTLIKPGITTQYLDEEAEKFILAHHGIPEFKDYEGFPASICTSINDEVVHGVPSARKLEEGDIISVDLGVRYNGYVGDSAKTFPVGTISPAAKKLLEVCEKSLYLGIEVAKIGNRISHIAERIQKYVESQGYSVVRDYTGHGIGRQMHEDPQVPNFVDKDLSDINFKLKAGHCIAIEPMVNIGTYRIKIVKRNGWEVVQTRDHQLSAHFEHSIAITEDGPQILTLPD